ncbi:MAG: hypothetical protein PHU25_06685 [Deltaproteobacteria bacterium]|nr:hypothetical protein [Deltaproteobacteria bacterium]
MEQRIHIRLARLAALLACSGTAACAGGSEHGRADGAPWDASTFDAAMPDANVEDAATAGDAGDGGPDSGWSYGIDCPSASPSLVPADSPRILIMGPSTTIAVHLQGILASDSSFTAPVVTGMAIASDPTDPTDILGGVSLMNFFYQPEGRDERLAPLAEPWSYVVLLEAGGSFAIRYPELHFEGVRVLACKARAAGAKPVVLMPWDADPASTGEVTYRVANGTKSVVVPTGYAWQQAQALGSLDWELHGGYLAAAMLYSTLTGRDAGATSYRPAGIPEDQAIELAAIARDSVVSEAGKVHYQGAYHGTVETRTLAPGGDFWFMDSGTSSEQIWYDRMNEILPRAGLAPRGTQIGYTNPQKSFDAACLDNALPYFEGQQYRILFARKYDLDAAAIAAAGAQTDLQVQVWDRHADSDPSDGIVAIEMLEFMSTTVYDQAKLYGSALVPYHLMFARLKTTRPSVQLLSDGVHATYPVGYGLATMSVVSRTGLHPSTDGLDSDTLLAAQLAEQTIRQLATLSVTGEPVPDDPSTRPTP